MENQTKIERILERREYFNNLFPKIKGCNYRKDIDFELPNSCPACGYFTLDERCSWEICLLCFWEDDGQDNFDADKIFGGPNGDYSLTKYRIEFFDEFESFKSENENSELVTEIKLLDYYISSNEQNIKKVELLINNILKNIKGQIPKL
ncbi:CPCC family cysteine-rich protein [Flavobacterium suncheonense]|uniref:CPCC family cysteine-rich protein n=1 Tax=Flavobacterium suncheonense TaxID=350894 RepID=UPI000557D59C|nr:CPCC family cysteine-rich protein [Flavobacterium suncheonense]